jgi:hypothetical protein
VMPGRPLPSTGSSSLQSRALLQELPLEISWVATELPCPLATRGVAVYSPNGRSSASQLVYRGMINLHNTLYPVSNACVS